MRVLVTGANGFIGQALVRKLDSLKYTVCGAVRDAKRIPANSAKQEYITVGAIDSSTDWSNALLRLDVVVHLAARVHVMDETAQNPLQAFREVNVEGTANLAEQAAKAGVKRFVYLSSIKVNGECTLEGSMFTADGVMAPEDPYGISKAEAERRLWDVSRNTGMEVVVVRPPLVYGPGVGGNFLRLIRLVKTGLPLPFGSIRNSRSMISLNNLNDLLILCVEKAEAAGETFLVSDGSGWSTPQLIKSIATSMGKTARLVPVPVSVLKLAAQLMGKTGMVDRLCDSLVVDSTKAGEILQWKPSQTPSDAVRQTVDWYNSK